MQWRKGKRSGIIEDRRPGPFTKAAREILDKLPPRYETMRSKMTRMEKKK